MRPICPRPSKLQHITSILAGCLTLATAVATGQGRAAVIVSCGFEPAGDSWSFSTPNQDKGVVNTNPGDADSPADQRIFAGAGSWLVADNTSSVVTFSTVLLSGWTNAAITYHVSSTAASSADGHSGGDRVLTRVAETVDGLDAASNLITLAGNSKLNWEYDRVAPPRVATFGGGNVSPPAGSSNFKVVIPDGHPSVALRIYLTSASPRAYWNLDEVVLSGTATASHDCLWAGSDGDAWYDSNSAATPWTDTRNNDSASAWNSPRGDNARFTRAGSLVTIAAETTVAARSLTFGADGCTIAAGDSASTLALSNGGAGGAGANTIEVTNSGQTATVNATIIGNPGVGVTKTGAGTLVLGGANTYTGPTAIRGGAVSVAHGYNLGAPGAPIALDGGTLRFTAPVDLRGDHPLELQSGGGVIDTQANDCAALSSGWSGSGALMKTGAGTLQLSGDGLAFAGAVLVQQGTLRLNSGDALSGCSSVTIDLGATLDLAAAASYHFGAADSQRLQGAGTVVGNLQIDRFGTHDVGSSPGVQCVQGNYTMDGALLVELDGRTPGNGATGYDQVLIANGPAFDVSLGGKLSLAWEGAGWSSPGDELWIIRNDTAVLTGAFSNYGNGESVGDFDGRAWAIYYGADAGTGRLFGGNDVLLAAATPVPEPGSFLLLLISAVVMWLAWRR